MGHLEDAVREGARLRAAETRVGVMETKAAETEPFVGAFEVGLDLGCRKKRQAGGRALLRGHDTGGEGGVDAARRRRAAPARADRSGSRFGGVLGDLELTAQSHRFLPENLGHLVGGGGGRKAVASQCLGHHHAAEALLRVGGKEATLERDGPAGGAQGRVEPRAGCRHGGPRTLHPVGPEHRVEHIVSGRHGRLHGSLAAQHDGVEGERGRLEGRGRKDRGHARRPLDDPLGANRDG